MKSSAAFKPKVESASNGRAYSGHRGKSDFFSGDSANGSFFDPVQPKLIVGQPGDRYEVEADAMADQVVQRLQRKEISPSPFFQMYRGNTALQSKCTACEEEIHKQGEQETSDSKDVIQRLPAVRELHPLGIYKPGAESGISLSVATGSPATGNNSLDEPELQAKEEEFQEEEPLQFSNCRECEESEREVMFKRNSEVLQCSPQSAARDEGSTRKRIVDIAHAELGKVEAKKTDPSGRRKGYDRLLEYFHLAAPNVWPDTVIEFKREGFPSWCGIFSVYSIKTAGIDVGNWQMGRGVSAFNTLEVTPYPKAGDIGYIDQPYQHHCIVTDVAGDSVKSIDGNSGWYSEVIEKTRPRSQFSGFLTPFTGRQNYIQKRENDSMSTPTEADIAGNLDRQKGRGALMDQETRGDMETSFNADFSKVRIHTGNEAVQMSKSLHAQAFTHGGDIYFNEGRYDPSTHSGKHLLAHELTHTLQQGSAIQRQPDPVSNAPEMVQGLGVLDLIPDWIIENARQIPGYTLFTVIIEYDPLKDRYVERTAVNLLEVLMGLVPFGTAIFDKLQEYGIIQRVFDWVNGQLNSLNLTSRGLLDLVEEAWDELEVPYTNAIEVITRKFQRLLDRIERFALSLVGQIMTWVKEALIDVAEPILEDNRAWSLIKKIIKYDPLRDQEVEATTVEILEDFLILIDRQTELEQMKERGTLQETADWLDTQVGTFMSLISELRGLVTALWDLIQPSNLLQIPENLQKLAGQVTSFLQRIWDFAVTVATEVLELIKKSLLGWLNSFAAEIPGFTLLTVILERNPLTDEEVRRTVENIIRGFMGLVPGGEGKFQELKQSGVIPRAAAQIEALIEEVGFSWAAIVQLFTDIWNSLGIEDLIDPLTAFERIAAQFGEPISRLFTFVVKVVRVIVELILEIMGIPPDMVANIIANAMQAFEDIKNDPVKFLLNLMNAVKEGFLKFLNNIGTHLLNGLQSWLFGTLADAGIQMPPDFSLRSILGLAMELLGITVDNILDRLALKIGEEKVAKIRSVLDKLSGLWAFIRDVMERGPIAIWEYIQTQISNLWNVIKEGIMGYIQEKVIQQAISWLLSFLDVTGIMPVIRGVQTVFNAISSFIEKLREILGIVNSFVAGVADIARGSIQTAAAFLETALADGIPVAISFLAKQLGLGDISEKIQEMVENARGMINEGIDWLIDRALAAGTAFLGMLGLGGGKEVTDGAEESVEEAQSGEYVYEGPSSGGHTIKITRNLEVFRFSDPEILTGTEAKSQMQLALESIVDKVNPVYPKDSLKRAEGPHGHVQGVKQGEDRLSLPALSTLPGGAAAYLPGDQRGHLIGDRFHGSSSAGNLVPMNSTLNLSTFKSFENLLAKDYNKLLAANKPVMLYMEVVPKYPGDDKGNPSNFRPTSISVKGKIITLKEGSASLQVDEIEHNDSLSNPSPVVTSININTADLTALRNVFRTEFADIIIAERNRNGRFTDELDFVHRISLQLGREAQITRITSMLSSREYLITMSELPGSPIQRSRNTADEGFGEAGSQATVTWAEELCHSKAEGSPLPTDAKSEMESSFGTDFSSVSVHTGEQAARLSGEINARAFTHGSDIYFNKGEYQPGTSSGKHLLAHELTHTIQQGASSPGTVMRSEEPEAGNTDPAGTIASGLVSNSEGTITYAMLPVTRFKTTGGREYLYQQFKLHRNKKYSGSRESINQRDIWREEVDATLIRNILEKKLKDAEGLKETRSGSHRIHAFRVKGGAKQNTCYLTGTLPSIVREATIPKWNNKGHCPRYFQVDHIVEMQISGFPGSSMVNTIDNLELLDASVNLNSGEIIRASIANKVSQTLRNKESLTALNEKIPHLGSAPDAESKIALVKSNYDLVFNDFTGKGGPMIKPDKYWIRTQIEMGDHLAHIIPVSISELGSEDNILVFPRRYHPVGKSFRWNGKDQTPTRAERGWFKPWVITGKSFLTEPPESDILGRLTLDFPAEHASVRAEGGIVEIRKLPGAQFAGYVDNVEGEAGSRKSIIDAGKFAVKHLSPVRFDEISFQDDSLRIVGKVLPTFDFIKKAELDLLIENGEVSIAKTFTSETLSLPAPFELRQTSLSLFINSARGMGIEGRVDFGIARLGEGYIEGAASRNSGFRLKGEFDFTSDLFDPARIQVEYKANAWSFGGTVGIPKGKVRGLKKAEAEVHYADEQLFARGMAQPDIKGFDEIEMYLSIRKDGYSFGGKIALQGIVPLLKKGVLELKVTDDQQGGFRISGGGSVEPDIPGLKSGTAIAITYNDGAILIQGKVPFSLGQTKAEGELLVGITNQKVDENNEPTGSISNEWTVFGKGNVSVGLGRGIAAAAEVVLEPNGDIIISGKVGLDHSKEKETDREITLLNEELFDIGPTSIVLFAIPPIGASLKLGIEGGARAYAYITPPHIKELSIGLENFNLTNPDDNFELQGEIAIGMSGRGGLEAYLTLKATLSVLVAAVEGRLTGSIGLEARGEATATVRAKWSRANGLVIEQGKLEFYADARFMAKLTGGIRVFLDLWLAEIDIWDEELDIASIEFGPAIKAGFELPVLMENGELRPGEFNKDALKIPDISSPQKQEELVKEGASQDEKVKPPPPPSKEEANQAVARLDAGPVRAWDILTMDADEARARVALKWISRDTYILWLKVKHGKIDWSEAEAIGRQKDRVDFNRFRAKFLEQELGTFEKLGRISEFEEDHHFFGKLHGAELMALIREKRPAPNETKVAGATGPEPVRRSPLAAFEEPMAPGQELFPDESQSGGKKSEPAIGGYWDEAVKEHPGLHDLGIRQEFTEDEARMGTRGYEFK